MSCHVIYSKKFKHMDFCYSKKAVVNQPGFYVREHCSITLFENITVPLQVLPSFVNIIVPLQVLPSFENITVPLQVLPCFENIAVPLQVQISSIVTNLQILYVLLILSKMSLTECICHETSHAKKLKIQRREEIREVKEDYIIEELQ